MFFFYYRVCQEVLPSLTVANEDIKTQNFWPSSKSQVATNNFCRHFYRNYNGWSNYGKYYKIENWNALC